MYPFCVFFIVKVKVLAGALVLRAVSKGLNAPGLTFDPAVCEKSKSKVRPKKKFARRGAEVQALTRLALARIELTPPLTSSCTVAIVAVEPVISRGLLDVQGFLYPELDRSTGPVQHPSAFPIHLMLLIPLMLCNGRFPCVPLVACIPVFFNSRLQAPL